MKADIWDAGAAARLKGKMSWDNPYPAGSEEYCMWLRGWNCATGRVSAT